MYLAVDFQALSDEESEWMRTYTSIRLSFRDTTAFVLPRLESFLRHILPSRKQVSRDVDHLNAKLMDMACKRREEIRARRLQSGDATDKKTDAEKDLLTMIMEGEMDGVGGLSTAEQLRVSIMSFTILLLLSASTQSNNHQNYNSSRTLLFSSWQVRIKTDAYDPAVMFFIITTVL